MTFIRRYPLLSYVLCCVIPVHGILWPLRLSGMTPESLQGFKLLFALIPSASAFLITYITHEEEGIRALWRKVLLKRADLKYYIFGLFGIAMLGLLAMGLRYFYDGHVSPFPDNLVNSLMITPFILLFPGFTEEFGWRGFLQEKLQSRSGVFLSSLLTGLVWGIWHGMDFLMGNSPTDTFSVLVFFAYILGTSVVIGGLYSLSNGSIAVAILAHFSANIVNFYLPVWTSESGLITPLIFVGLLWLVAIFILISDLRKGVLQRTVS